jgi:succinyl-diaminopimelate desuccinylase
MSKTLHDILWALIQNPSITPNDAGCQDEMILYLESLGFHCQRFNHPPVSNFFACIGEKKPLLVFAGHTDVVPVGDETQWDSNPFQLHERNGMLYGRGVADMKGSLACMMLAASLFVKTYPDFQGSLGFLITSGEEGNDYEAGTPFVMKQLQEMSIHIDYCIVGEPSSSVQVGDVIKVGRRGSLHADILIHGKEGHVAYPHLADNPIHKLAPFLHELTTTQWDAGNAYFPPTTLQVTHIQSGGIADNIVPGELQLHLNFRFSTEQTAAMLEEKINTCLARHQLQSSVEYRLSGQPFLTKQGRLVDCCDNVIQKITGNRPKLSTSGGTSDGRFIAPFGVEVVELGPVNATIHQINECVSLPDLDALTEMYYQICVDLLVT